MKRWLQPFHICDDIVNLVALREQFLTQAGCWVDGRYLQSSSGLECLLSILRTCQESLQSCYFLAGRVFLKPDVLVLVTWVTNIFRAGEVGEKLFFFVEFLSTVFKAWSATTAWPGRDLAGAWSAGIDHTTYYGPSSLLPRPSQLLKWQYQYDLVRCK